MANILAILFFLFFFLLIFLQRRLNFLEKLHPSFFRSLIPSWRFFDRRHCHHELLVRIESSQKSFGPWVSCLSAPPRNLFNLFFDPQSNIHLASHRVIQSLVSELNQNKLESNNVSYLLTKNLVVFYLKDLPPQSRYQFKLMVEDVNGKKIQALLSPLYSL